MGKLVQPGKTTCKRPRWITVEADFDIRSELVQSPAAPLPTWYAVKNAKRIRIPSVGPNSEPTTEPTGGAMAVTDFAVGCAASLAAAGLAAIGFSAADLGAGGCVTGEWT